MTDYVLRQNRNINLAGLIVGNYRDCIGAKGRAVDAALNRTAFSIQKDVKKQMPRYLDNPTKQTVNSLLVQRSGRGSRREQGKAYVFFREFSSEYLNPNIVGENLTELYEIAPVFNWNISGLNRSPVRKALRIRAKFEDSNNIPNVKGLFERMKNHPNTFEIKRQGYRLKPGWYFRFREGLFTLGTYERSTPRKPIFPFPELAETEYERVFAKNWKKSVRECLSK